jgi:chromosome segregation ATPase
MNKQIQQNTGVQNQARQFEQRATILELQTKERDSELVLLRNDQQSLQLGTSRVQYQIAKSDSKINSLQSKNQEQKLKIISLEYQLKEKDNTMNSLENEKKTLSTANQFIIEMVETQKSLLQSKINEMELLRQNMERQLADEKKRNEVLEHEIRALKRERAQDQTSTSLLSNDRTNPTNVGSNRGGDDDSAQNNINYDSELDNTEERQDDEVNDINYDTPSEDGDK